MTQRRQPSDPRQNPAAGDARRWSLTLRVDAPAVPGEPTAHSSRSEALRREVYSSLKLKVQSVAWVTIDPATASGGRVLSQLAERHATGGLVVGAAILTETFGEEDRNASPWLLLATRQVDDFNLWNPYPTRRRGWPREHALNRVFVSSAFVAAVLQRRLKGLMFLQCQNGPRVSGEPWFVALPERSLGRGLDHPWFDRSRWLAYVTGHPERRSSSIEEAQSAFHQRWLRDAVRRKTPLDTILPLCPQSPTTLEGLTVVTIPRYWAAALPESDFGYLPWGEDGPNRDGKRLRFRQLALSARAAEALQAEGVVSRKALLPVRVEQDIIDGRVVLDRRNDTISPMYSNEELGTLRAHEAAMKSRAR